MTWENFHNRMLSRIKKKLRAVRAPDKPKLLTLGFSLGRRLVPASWDLAVSLSILKKKILRAVLGSMLSTFFMLSHLTQPRVGLH